MMVSFFSKVAKPATLPKNDRTVIAATVNFF